MEPITMASAATWYKDALIYQLHVRSFCDSDGDGVGDFAGLLQKLDYLQDLGITAIWLLPFYPSPLRDDGYDIADYLGVHPQYGTLEAFQAFLDAAHDRGLKVITELVLNHTSDQHPWFQRARRAPPGSPERDFYVWSDQPDRYADARIIFKDFEPSNWTYDREAGAYYWHRFYSHQPDLNFDNPAVRAAMLPIVDFWFGRGVDGMRLDAVPYLFEREGTNCENLPETHGFLRELRRHIDERYRDRMLLAEANQWPEDAAAYFGAGDECHMAFHFPVMPRLFMGIMREDRFPIVDIIEQTPAIPASCQWATFLRNHDELTLEMVTDEERDYMYRAYAAEARARINFGIRRRLAPLLSNNRRRLELLHALLFSLPGTPVMYYGDEIGMGDNIYLGDRNGVRTPMQWSSDRNAGFSRANPQRLFLPVIIDPEFHYETVNVEAQQNNPYSFLWWVKRLIDVRRRCFPLSRGAIEFLHPANRKVLAFVRQHEGETILVAANLSRFVQYVELSLEGYEGQYPVEMFGGSRLPRIGAGPYALTLGPNSFYWLRLEARLPERRGAEPRPEDLPALHIRRTWREFLRDDRDELQQALADYLTRRLDHLPLDAVLRPTGVDEVGRLDVAQREVSLTLLRADSSSGATAYLTPLLLVQGAEAEHSLERQVDALVARVEDGQPGVLADAATDARFVQRLTELILRSGTARIAADVWLQGTCSAPPPETDWSELAPVTLIRHEGRSTTLAVGQRYVLKILREVAIGPHPAVEAGVFLARHGGPAPAAPLRGYLELRSFRNESTAVALLYDQAPHEGTAWQLALDALADYYEHCAAAPAETAEAGAPAEPWADAIGASLSWAALLGRRLAELHRLLGGDPHDPEFRPEPPLLLQTRSLYQSLRGDALATLEELRQRLRDIPEEWRENARELTAQRETILRIFRRVLDERRDTVRIRCHGNLQLSRLLFTGKDFLVADFAGDPRTPLSERRIRRRPWRDVAAVLHSLDYASRVALAGLSSGRGRVVGLIRESDRPRAAAWGRAWRQRVQAALLAEYERHLEPVAREWNMGAATRPLLHACLVDRALSDVAAELHNRPLWLGVALESALEAVQVGPPA